MLTGEKIVTINRKHLGRKGRGDIRFRVVGDHSSAWAEAASLWGGTVEFIVHADSNNHFFNTVLRLPLSVSAASVQSLPVVGDSGWDGILLATLLLEAEARLAGGLFRAWRPLIAIYALKTGLPNKTKSCWLHIAAGAEDDHEENDEYSVILSDRAHSYFGGVTLARWPIACLTRSMEGVTRGSVMTARQIDRPLQTALDDTVGGDNHAAFDEIPPGDDSRDGRIGYARRRGVKEWRPVYDGRRKAPDIGSLDPLAGRRIWVVAGTVFGTKSYAGREGCLRQLTHEEVLSVWDYEGKEPSLWGEDLRRVVTAARLCSPPAKMIRSFVFAAGDRLHRLRHPVVERITELGVGQTGDVLFNPLKEATEGRLKAAQTDDAGVELVHWSHPGETPAEARARNTLRRLALRWWKHLQTRQARDWLALNPGKTNTAAIEDCIRRIQGATYWAWPRGSRIFFWKFHSKGRWFEDFRDGVRYWKMEEPPAGSLHNMPSSSREAQLLARFKVFQLRFQRFIFFDGKTSRCVIPRFLVPKVVADDGTILDVRCVWDCRRNGHNATLYAPGFMLPTALDAEDQVIKWLSLPVAEYLRLGSPRQDYTQDADCFVRSVQADIDIGKHFKNF